MTERHALYVIGEPGVGKSELVAAMTVRVPLEETRLSPFAHRRYSCGVTELGRRREAFSGTDTLPLNVQPKVIEWLTISAEGLGVNLILGEGDRLANGLFFSALRSAGIQLHLYVLQGRRLAAARREARGSDQDPTWIKGRQSKVDSLADTWAATPLDASVPLPILLRSLWDPVATALRIASVGDDDVQPSVQ